ncbi:CopG family transcriptional regulator [Thermococci archaeon]|uniref:CopG family transcriptional regulator n=1 Tax=Palaeococcus sp. (in: euryarchaeotes) TaxID=2820298 RepID=UPI000F2CD8DE|nr:CopG family transcriptional regulator [Palaeococcus sp. (in: euryarchaeotes)]MCD6558353.1 CopG family transcriptional regulator [Palaeococcus sp. (in: euryarchaeotes)]RLF76965.1 MAG: CopG family transcriptional regulator [Thermococci archaeon]RLF90816.1 MAG: CopG family transcriptional regulator [Thermococci archaeon]
MPREGKIPKLFSGSIDELTQPAKIEKEGKKKDLKKVKKQKTLFVSQDMNLKLIELYAHEGRRQSVIVEDAVNLYYYLKKAMGERKFGELMSVVGREDEKYLREYLEKFTL